MKCSKCKGVLFTIQVIPCCDDCDQNGAYDENGDLVYDEKIIDEKDLTRDEVAEDGECKMDTAYGAGCFMFVCNSCHHKTNLPVMDGC